MSFTDTTTVKEVYLCTRISIRDDDDTWVTGKIVALELLGDEQRDVRVTLLLDNETVLSFDRAPDTLVIIEW